MANFKVFYTIPKWNLKLNCRGTYRSKYGQFDTNGNDYLDDFDNFINAYTIWDLAVDKTFYKKYQVALGSDNIFNFIDGQNINNIPGRLIYAKLNIQF